MCDNRIQSIWILMKQLFGVLQHKKFNLTEFKIYGTFKPTTLNFHNKKKLPSYKRKKNQEIKVNGP